VRYALGVVCFLMGLFFTPLAASAQGDRCPAGYSNDDCDEWRVDGAEKVLSQAIESRVARGTSLTTRPHLIEAIKQTSMDAHRAWLAFREAECKAFVAASIASARTDRGKKMSCLLHLTEQRIAEVNKP
jgi:uncharacterized protein YecT (DUF1311 family)